MDWRDPITTLLQPILIQRLSATQRLDLAHTLRTLADEQERIAHAMQRDQRRPAPDRLQPRSGKGGRPGSMHVYLDVRLEAGRSEPTYTLRIGRAIYAAYQALRRDPAADLRMAVQVVDRQLILSEDPNGYAVTVNLGGIRINVSGSRDELAAIAPGVRLVAVASTSGIVADL
ncbi:hypothetical protein [Candidatus Chloroploca sp. Khr17]|uniref:hypothetical protein n=1 Tax=Candidatus Chloroploca sp. Khr17 TaxID=2496869 RepID=UPI00101CDC49|nr:hypothetical protein [Candidatus Chloroploca sp. Khr17]